MILKEYRIAKKWAFFLWISSPILIALFTFLAIMPFFDNTINWTPVFVLTPVSIGMVLLVGFGLIEAHKGRFILKIDRLVSMGVFGKKELLFEDIKGYRIRGGDVLIEPISTVKKRILLSRYTEGYHEILCWLAENYPNLNKIEAKTEKESILNNRHLGETREEREEKLANARKTTKIINFLGVISFVWATFFPKPYEYALFAVFIIPLVALVLVKTSRGLIRFDKRDESTYPAIAAAFLFSSLSLALRGVSDYNIPNYSDVWLIAAGITVLLLFILLVGQKEFSFKKKLDFIEVFCIVLIIYAYSLGSTIYLNCNFDKSESQHFTAKILNKRIQTSHYLELTTWEEVSVPEELYQQVEIADEVTILFKKGALEIPWLVVTKTERNTSNVRKKESPL